MKKAIITGITGQDGAYLSKLLLCEGYEVIGLVRSYNSSNLYKLEFLGIESRVIIEECDLCDINSFTRILEKYNPDEVYNLAAQSSVGLSFSQPIGTIHFNLLSVLNILEAIKGFNKDIKIYQASSSEMYGKVSKLPVKEDSVIHPLSPYGISKASAHWCIVNYRESFGIFACSGILFNHESHLRSGNFFIRKVIKEAVNIINKDQNEIQVGNIDVKRDFGYAPKYVEAMYLMLQQDDADDFIICSGNSVYLRDIIYYVFEKLNISKDKIIVNTNLYRPADIIDIYGDSTKAREKLKWNYDISFYQVLDILIDEEIKSHDN